MKNAIIGAMCFIFLLSAGLMAEQSPVEYGKQEVKNIDFMLNCYEMDGDIYEMDFNFHVGYLHGQRKAYLGMIEAISKSRD